MDDGDVVMVAEVMTGMTIMVMMMTIAMVALKFVRDIERQSRSIRYRYTATKKQIEMTTIIDTCAVMDNVVDNRTVGILKNTARSNLVTVLLRYFPVFQKTEHRYFCFSVFVGISQHRITVYDGRSIGIVSVL